MQQSISICRPPWRVYLRDGEGPHEDLERLGNLAGEHQAGAVAQFDSPGKEDGLEVLGVAGGAGYRDSLPPQQSVDKAALTNVGVADSSKCEHLIFPAQPIL